MQGRQARLKTSAPCLRPEFEIASLPDERRDPGYGKVSARLI